MTDEQKMSRRDWFRLRIKRDGKSMGDSQSGLQPIAHPENHHGMDLRELPPMREAFLSDEEVRLLFSDIEACASNILLMQRSANSQRAAASRASAAEQLHAARDAILSGAILRVQIRYHWQQADWIDTLERRDQSVRLVRIAHQTPHAAG